LTIWETDNDPAYGVIVIAERMEDRACTVKELVYDEQAKRSRLRPVNPDMAPPSDDGGWYVTARLVGVVRATDGPERTWFLPVGLRPRHLKE
jgi:SOS-response transcriptional repressor LexA